MVADAVNLSAQVMKAILSALSARVWSSVKPAFDQRKSASPEASWFANEVNSVAEALSESSGILDGSSRRYVLQTCEADLRNLLRESPELEGDFSAFVAIVRAVLRRTVNASAGSDFLVSTSSKNSTPQISIGTAEHLPDSEREDHYLSSWESILVQPSELLVGTHMEFSGDRVKAAKRTSSSLSTIWESSALAGLIDPPLELLPNDLYGKKEALSRLEDSLQEPDGKIHLLCGEPGTGKRIAALAIAENAKRLGKQVWWVRGTAELMAASMTAVAVKLDADPVEIAEAHAGRRSLPDLVWEYIERADRPWLLVFDDVDDRGALERFLYGEGEGSGWIRPSRRGVVLVTSRFGDEKDSLRHLTVHQMQPFKLEDAVEFLRTSAPEAGTENEAAELARYLRQLPLACRLAALHIASSDTLCRTFLGYLAELKEPGGQLSYARHDDENAWLALNTRIIIQSMNHSENAGAWTLLAILSYFAPGAPLETAILDPETLAEMDLAPWTVDAPRRQAALSESLEFLHSLGLIESAPPPSGGRPSTWRDTRMHPMISLTCRSIIENEPQIANIRQEQVWVAAATLMHRAARQWPVAMGMNWAGGYELEPHISALIRNLPSHSPSTALEEAVQAARIAMDHLDRTRAHLHAEQMGRRAMQLSRSLPHDNPVALTITCDLARVLMNHGRLGEAEKLLQAVLEISQRALGLEHRASLDALELLASVLHRRGDIDQAEQMLRQVMPGRERADGQDSPATIRAMTALARVLREQGKLGEAERLARSVISIVRDRYGNGHQDTLTAETDLGSILRTLGHLDKSERLLKRVLQEQEALLGSEHQDTCNTMAELAETFRDLGQLTLAEHALVGVLETRRRMLGPEDPDTINAAAELAEIFRDQARFQESETLIRQVLRVRRRTLGSDSPETLNAKLGLAVIFYDTGQLEKAKKVLDEIIDNCKTSIGFDHPVALSARHNLATVLQGAGRIDEAEKLYRDVLDRREWTLGPNHPETLRTLVNLASLLYLRGFFEEAQHSFRQAESVYSDIYGPWHPYTMTAKNNVANVLMDKGMPEDANGIYRRILDVQRKTLGRDRPETLTTCINFAISLVALGQMSQADSLLNEAVAGYRRIFDTDDHPSLLMARYRSARLRERKGDWEDSLDSYRSILALQVKRLGEDHPDAIATRLSISRVLEILGRHDESEAEYRQAIKLAVERG